MKICLIAEGSYPYVTGGVSSWIDQLMRNLPELEFEVIAISSDRQHCCTSHYNRPENMTALHDVYLDEILREHGSRRRIALRADEIERLRAMILGNTVDWPGLFAMFSDWHEAGISARDLLLSRSFFDLVSRICLENYPRLAFSEIYWTIHSMYQLVFALLLRRWPQADIYHAVSTGYAGVIGAVAAYEQEGLMLLTEHGIYTREREEEIIKADWVRGYLKNIWIDYFTALSRCAYQSADHVISLFERNRGLQEELGCPADKTWVIHNGIKLQAFSAIAEQVRARGPEDKLRIGAIIRVVPIKDIKTMLQAFAIVSKRFPEAEFIIMGPVDEDPSYYEDCLRSKKLLRLNQVVFTGCVDIKSMIGSMDMLVLSSISEGQPLAILEGLACSLPCVCTDVGDCRMMIDDLSDHLGPAGRIVPIMDPGAMAGAIIDLASNFQLRRQMGETGLNRVRLSYDFDSFVNSYRELYKNLEIKLRVRRSVNKPIQPLFEKAGDGKWRV